MMRRLQIKIVLFCLMVLTMPSCFSQVNRMKSDIESLNMHLKNQLPVSEKKLWIYSNEPFSIKKCNPLGLIAGGSLFVYQHIMYRHIEADCLFTPNCPEFSRQALKEEGLIKGGILSIDRISRCNRIAGQDLRHYSPDPISHRYPDPVSRYRKDQDHHAE